MKQDRPELPEEIDLSHLGRVAPPDPGVLDAAREILWAAVAQEMLSVSEAVGEAGQIGETGPRRAARREIGQRETGQCETGQRETG
jgi:hypothetical protein